MGPIAESEHGPGDTEPDATPDAGPDAEPDAEPDAGVPEPPAADAAGGRYAWVGVGIAVALVAGLVAWIVIGRMSTPDATVVDDLPVAATEAELAALTGEVGHVVYWAGPQDGVTYELTRTADGRIYVRYLPAGVEIGSPEPSYLTVATYQDDNAFATMEAAGKRAGATATTATSGALIVTSADSPGSAFFAFPDVPFVMEVFDPEPGKARALVESGQVQPIR